MKIMINISEHLKDLDSRVDNIKTYHSFFEIANSMSKEKCPYDPFVIIFGLLAFLFYEGKLALKKLDVNDIIKFVKGLLAEVLGAEPNPDDVRELAYYVLDKMQNKGAGFNLTYYSTKYKSTREKNTKLIDIKLDEKADKIYYFITNDGLDFYLKTKEFIEESQITTSLLVFRAQIRNGSFGNALETVRELKIKVHRRLDYKNELLDLLMYGTGEESEKYGQYHDAVNLLFEEEEMLFNNVYELLTKVREEYLVKINKKLLTKKDDESLRVLTQIDQEMKETSFLHKMLLNDAASLPGEKEKIRLMRLNSAFSVRFDFEKELEDLVAGNANPEGLKYFIDPLLLPRVRKSYNVLKIFTPQKVSEASEDTEEIVAETEDKPIQEKLDDLVNSRIGINFRLYASLLIKLLLERKEIDLKDWISSLKGFYGEKALINGDLISFIIQLNLFDKWDGVKVINLEEIRLKPYIQEEANEAKFDTEYLARLFAQITPNNLSKVYLESKPEEDVDLGYGIKITNLNFRGVIHDFE